jgi:hypothetical protein
MKWVLKKRFKIIVFNHVHWKDEVGKIEKKKLVSCTFGFLHFLSRRPCYKFSQFWRKDVCGHGLQIGLGIHVHYVLFIQIFIGKNNKTRKTRGKQDTTRSWAIHHALMS